jgi:hypothetical protein
MTTEQPIVADVSQDIVTSNSTNEITFTDVQGEPTPFSAEQLQFLEDDAKAEAEQPLIFGKFKTMEDAEKAHKALEQGFHEDKAEDKADVSTEGTEVAPAVDADETLVDTEVTDEEPEKALEEEVEVVEPGQAVEDAFISLVEAGEVTEDILEKFSKAGIPAELVEVINDLAEYKTNGEHKAVYDSAGGEEAYAELTTWAAHNYTDTEKAAFDLAVTSGTQEEKLTAVANLSARSKANAPTPRTSQHIKADALTNSSVGYESEAQLLSDMASPLYKSDEAYRNKVTAKSNRSNY